MRKPFVVLRDALGWTVFDQRTGAPAISASRELTGLANKFAREEATLMNVLALNQTRAAARRRQEVW